MRLCEVILSEAKQQMEGFAMYYFVSYIRGLVLGERPVTSASVQRHFMSHGEAIHELRCDDR